MLLRKDAEFESGDTKKQVRGSTSTKRSRAAEVHNLSERVCIFTIIVETLIKSVSISRGYLPSNSEIVHSRVETSR